MNVETKPNEFIPSGGILTHVNSNSCKNLNVIYKLFAEKNWRFEPDENQPNANLSHEIEVEFQESKPSSSYYSYNNQNMRLNLSNMSGQERYGQVRSGKN